MATEVQTRTIETRVPARMDRLPWSTFHWRVVIGLGTVWTLDGLEVTMVGAVAGRLVEPGSGLNLTPGQVGLAAAIYIAGACLGALFFGQLTDRFGRKKLFLITLLVYIIATVATAFSFAPWYFYLARFLTGAGIGGEYAAIHSAIDELIPARVRGRVDLVISGTYWLGSAAGAGLALVFLNEAIFPADVGWRLAFGAGAVLGLVILFVRRHVPESPRWLFIHGREDEAEAIVDGIEDRVRAETGQELEEPDRSLRIRQRRTIPISMIAGVAFERYPRRAVLGLALFVGQAFLYNGITFNLSLLMTTFFGVASAFAPVFFVVFALGNFLGPLTLGRLFDSVGRKPMIVGTYLGSALLTLPLAWLFFNGALNAWTFIGLVVAVFFLASAGASSAYLTVSEIFPMETRALAIAFFYAVGTAIGGITGPLLFGRLIRSEQVGLVVIAFLIGAGVMAVGGIIALFYAVPAAQANLEDVARPLTAHDEDDDGAEADRRDEAGGAEERGRGRRHEARLCREEAAHARARAAEHRAEAHERGVDPDGDGSEDGDRGRAERTLAEIADLRARELDEQATAQEELAVADESDAHAAAAATQRAEAARERADALAERAAALGAERDADADSHLALAEAAAERARAREQRALAERALAGADPETDTDPDAETGAGRSDGDGARGTPDAVARARAAMHTAWAEAHDERARAWDDVAVGREPSPPPASPADAPVVTARVVELEHRALAAEQRLRAAEFRAGAEEHRAEREASERARARQAERTARERQVREMEDRIRARVTRREEHARGGLRRLRPGPGRTLAPSLGGLEVAPADSEAALDHEVETVARALVEHGPTERQELARLVGARYWGPGRFGGALDTAVAEGRIRRLSRRTFGPPENG